MSVKIRKCSNSADVGEITLSINFFFNYCIAGSHKYPIAVLHSELKEFLKWLTFLWQFLISRVLQIKCLRAEASRQVSEFEASMFDIRDFLASQDYRVTPGVRWTWEESMKNAYICIKNDKFKQFCG